MSTLCSPIPCVHPILQSHWDKMDNPMDSYLCPLYAAQTHVSVLSYSPMWDKMDYPMDSYLCPLSATMCPSHPTVPCGIRWTILWTPIYVHSLQPNPMCPSYPTVPCGIRWTILWTPIYVHCSPIPCVHCILQSHVG